jgi:hypothetical protein
MVQRGGGGRRSRNFRVEGPQGDRVPPSRRSHDRMQARAERRQKANRRFLMVAAGVVSLVAVLVAAVVLWPEEKQTPPAPAPIAPVAEVKTGQPLEATSIDGVSFRFAGVRPVVDGRSVGAEYTVTNVGTQEALFEMPVDLFVRNDRLPEGTPCNHHGAPSGSCSPRNKSSVVGPVGTSPQLRKEGADLYMPPGASYLVRVTTVVPMELGVSAGDVSLTLWSSRFYRDQVGRPVPFPK